MDKNKTVENLAKNHKCYANKLRHKMTTSIACKAEAYK